ncbi:RCY1 [[Candida] subhashii]|uniref:RCY1 n=1 Tax=[Candida] subhashii TaxID=561895 RepID=A0A8J5Q8U4_9ASCO|nr:RCY1 [[Candida] subhashii]KAG7661521.1 RCY1 [[Candida] subhashii]
MAQVIWNSDIDVYNTDVMPLSIARGIARYLPIQDLLSFAQVSRNTNRAVSDPSLWVSMLKEMGVWNNAKQITKDQLRKNPRMSYLESPLSCLDYVYRSNKNAKYQMLKIHRCLYPYYKDLLVNKSYDQLRIFKDFQTPEEQAQLLTNLLIYNRIDYIESTRNTARDKINELIEIFENALLRELEIHFDLEDYEKTRQFVMILVSLQNQQTLIDFFLQRSIFDNEEREIFNLEKFEADKYYNKVEQDDDQEEQKKPVYTLNQEAFESLIQSIAEILNEQSKIIDLIFPQSIPMMYKVCEELISNQLSELIMMLIDSSKQHNLYLTFVPFIYEKLTVGLIEKLTKSENLGDSYHQLVIELLNMSFESFAAEYMREEVSSYQILSKDKILDWKLTISKREQETTQKILEKVKVESKNDFLTSFKNVFTMASNKEDESNSQEKYSEIQAKAKILSENIKTLDKIFSPELVVETLNDAKISLHRLLKLREFTISSLRNDIFQSIQDIFIDAMEIIGVEHLRPGFEKALTYLQTYNPNSSTYTETHNESFAEPLVLFFDLINMADIIIQMIDIFYKEEMLNRHIIKHENSILNPSLQNKKKLEALVDKYVADGLNVGIEILVHQIDTVYDELLLDTDYNPTNPNAVDSFGPTDAAKKAISVLQENMNLLVDSADMSVVEVFQHEIAERFFQIIVKTLKHRTISVAGAPSLISDLNLYYEFMVEHIKTNKRLILPLYQALKKVGNIYLISGDDSKSIGQLVSDLSKFNGIFGQEEIYEFVQRRQDWPDIKRHVEKVIHFSSIMSMLDIPKVTPNESRSQLCDRSEILPRSEERRKETSLIDTGKEKELRNRQRIIRKPQRIIKGSIESRKATAAFRLYELSQIEPSTFIDKLIEIYGKRRYPTFVEDLHLVSDQPKHPIHKCIPNYLRHEDFDLESDEPYPKNEFIRGFPRHKFSTYLFEDICQIILQDDYELLRDIVSLLYRLGILTESQVNLLSIIEDKKSFMSEMNKRIIESALQKQKTNIATEFVLQLTKTYQIEVHPESIDLLVLTLTSGLHEDFIKDSYITTQFVHHFGIRNLTVTQVDRILQFFCSKPRGMYFANFLFEKLVKLKQLEGYSRFQPIEFSNTVKALMQSYADNYNIDTAFRVWKQVSPYIEDKSELVPILVQLFIDAPVEYAADIGDVLSNLPAESLNSEEMIDFQLSFFASDPKLSQHFELLANRLQPPLKRTTMSSLLKAFLAMNKQSNAQKTIEAIFKHGGGTSPEDVNCIVERLLKQDKLGECMDMVERMEFEISRLACVSILRYMLLNVNISTTKNREFLDRLFLGLVDLQDANTNELLTIALIEVAVAKVPIDEAVMLYNAIAQVVTLHKRFRVGENNYNCKLNTISIPEKFERVLHLSLKGQAKCLEHILIKALKEEDPLHLSYIMGLFRSLGWNYTSILNLLRRYDQNGYLERAIKSEILRDCN